MRKCEQSLSALPFWLTYLFLNYKVSLSLDIDKSEKMLATDQSDLPKYICITKAVNIIIKTKALRTIALSVAVTKWKQISKQICRCDARKRTITPHNNHALDWNARHQLNTFSKLCFVAPEYGPDVKRRILWVDGVTSASIVPNKVKPWSVGPNTLMHVTKVARIGPGDRTARSQEQPW